MAKKIQLMHELFGEKYGKHCRDCLHFSREWTNTRSVYKCEVYGRSNSEATDWAGKYDACGMFDKPWGDLPVRRLANQKESAPENDPLPGQTSFLEMEV